MPADLSIRHIIATLTYRAAKVLRDAPEGFNEFRAAPGSRAAGEILAHICDVLDWALSQARGEEHWSNSNPAAFWAEDSERFFAATTALDQYLAAHESHVPLERLFPGRHCGFLYSCRPDCALAAAGGRADQGRELLQGAD